RVWQTRRSSEPEATAIWHSLEAAAAEELTQWYAAGLHLGRLLALAQDALERDAFRKRREDVLHKAFRRDPDDTAILAAFGRVRLEQGDTGTYRSACAALVRLAPKNKDADALRRASRLSVLAPRSVEDFAPVLETAEKAAARGGPIESR